MKAPIISPTMYHGTRSQPTEPMAAKPMVTAGFRCAPVNDPMAYTPTATASAQPVVMTIQPAFCALDLVRRTPATTPSPRMIRSPVPTISASMIWKPSVKVPMPRSLSVQVSTRIPRVGRIRGESDRRRAPPSALFEYPRSPQRSVGVVILSSREIAVVLFGVLVRSILLAFGEVTSPLVVDGGVARLLSFGEVAP